MKYFGTDGIRGIVEKNFDNKLIKKIARGLVRFYNKSKIIETIIYII